MDPRYLKFDTWLIVSSYTSIAGCGLQLEVIYSVFEELMISPRSFAAAAVLVSCAVFK